MLTQDPVSTYRFVHTRPKRFDFRHFAQKRLSTMPQELRIWGFVMVGSSFPGDDWVLSFFGADDDFESWWSCTCLPVRSLQDVRVWSLICRYTRMRFSVRVSAEISAGHLLDAYELVVARLDF